MHKQLEQLKEFHKAFGTVDPKFIKYPDLSIASLRAKLINEESKEVTEELLASEPDISKIAKELADLLYVTYGTINQYGLTDVFDSIFDEVHRSNMSKLENGKPVYREDGKVMKGLSYSPADIETVISEHIINAK